MAQSTAQNTLDLLILRTLARGPNHGFGITVHIQDVSEGLLRIEEGSLYPALHRLEREKAVTGEWKTSDNGRRARYYKLTPPAGSGSKRMKANGARLARELRAFWGSHEKEAGFRSRVA